MPVFSRIFYSLAYGLFLLFYGPLYLLFTRHRREAAIPWLERLGRLPADLVAAPSEQTSVWIHAVSVGEVNLLGPLIHSLQQSGIRIFLSTTTETGQQLAVKRFAETATVFFFPLDLRWSCRRYLQRIRPDRILIVETELWPNFIWEAERQSIPVVLINGRISDTSFRRYRRVRPLLRPVLSAIDLFCMQSRVDKDRILELGAPPERVHWVGNLKFDYQLPRDPEKEKEKTTRWIGDWLSRGRDLIWVCGSTREKEEKILGEIFCRLRERFPRLRIVFVPRHPHRASEVGRQMETLQLGYAFRSHLNTRAEPPAQPPDCLIVDTIGELAYLYDIADVVFMGGSLFPTGGHNIIEAAYFSKPILFGPHMENFREIAAHFLDSYAALQVKSVAELTAKLTGLLEDETARSWLGRNARKVVRDNQGALERTLELLKIESG